MQEQRNWKKKSSCLLFAQIAGGENFAKEQNIVEGMIHGQKLISCKQPWKQRLTSLRGIQDGFTEKVKNEVSKYEYEFAT